MFVYFYSYSYADMYRVKSLLDKGDGPIRQDVKQQHEQNLWEMVNYCENTSDCRQMLQLQYLGEVFDPNLCKSSETPCDNCRKGKPEVIDISDFAVQLVEMVTTLSSRQNNFERNLRGT